jgi:Uma2 family endonuclease
MATQTDPKETLRSPITVQQWGEIDGSPRYDLVDGELVERSEEPFWHALLLMEIARIVFNHVHEHEIGMVVTSKAKLRISAFGGREPDLFFIPTDQYHLVGKNLFKGVPPLVVEILSPSNEDMDRHDKAREYAGLGVGQYWIVDFPARRLEVHALRPLADGGRGCELIEMAEGDAVFRPGLFPGLEIPLGEVWPAEFEHRTDD